MEEKLREIETYVKTIDLANIIGEGIELTPEGEELVANVVRIKKLVKETEAAIDAKLKDLIADDPAKVGYEGDHIRLTYSPKTTYAVTEETDARYCVLKKEVNKKKVEEYEKLTKNLPAGVTKKITFSIRKTLV